MTWRAFPGPRAATVTRFVGTRPGRIRIFRVTAIACLDRGIQIHWQVRERRIGCALNQQWRRRGPQVSSQSESHGRGDRENRQGSYQTRPAEPALTVAAKPRADPCAPTSTRQTLAALRTKVRTV